MVVLHTAASPDAPSLVLPDTYRFIVSVQKLGSSAGCTGSCVEGDTAKVACLEDSLGSFAAADASNTMGLALMEAAEQLHARAVVVPFDKRSRLVSALALTSVPSFAVRHTRRPLVLVRY